MKILLLRIRQRIATICVVVLILPPSSAAITISFESATTLSPVTRNSLAMMVIAIYFSLSFMVGQSHFTQIIASLIIGLTVYLFVWLVMPGGIKRLRELYSYLLLIFPRKRDSQENVQ